MQGQYKGFSALLSEKCPTQIRVWCYSHILNLVLSDTTQCVLASGSLFYLMNNIAVFCTAAWVRFPHGALLALWGRSSPECTVLKWAISRAFLCGVCMFSPCSQGVSTTKNPNRK